MNRKQKRKLYIAIIFLVGLAAILRLETYFHPKNIVSPINAYESSQNISSQPSASSQASTISFNYNDMGLTPIVKNDLAAADGDYAIVIEGLGADSSQRYYLNEQTVYPSASVYKVFLLAAIMQAEQNGTL